MFNSAKLMLVATAVAALVACGGGGDDDGNDFTAIPYGAIAVNLTTGAGGIAANYDSQGSANNRAVALCGAGCNTVLEFSDSGQCAALARGNNLSLGWNTGNSKSDASSKAVARCVTAKGVGCVALLAECNS